MYSAILMTALTASSATPDWHHHGGCYGGGYGGCYGCWGGYSSWSPGCALDLTTRVPGGYGLMGGTVVPGTGTGSEELGKPTPNKNGDKETMAPTRAKLVVGLPANAKLFIDDMAVKATAGVQTFDTPSLEPGQAYYYMVRVEATRDGRPVSETRHIIVQAGQVARADFGESGPEAVRTAQAK